MTARAARVGPNVAIFAEIVKCDRKQPEQGYRTCLGVIRLADKFGAVPTSCGLPARVGDQRQVILIAISWRSLRNVTAAGQS